MEKNNKIIAEFMGFNNFLNPNVYNIPVGGIQNDIHYKADELKFHSNWNWLMEVIEKIESIEDLYHGRFGVYISSNSCTIQSTNFRPDKPIPNPPHYYDNIVLNTKIESTYYSVLNFINFYNKQKEE